ncbi:MAG: GNAT family N-acetyltransferase [Clostridia bacterium]|nr:GNAT family N-acetyltransferase [Clostridia bacterium]
MSLFNIFDKCPKIETERLILRHMKVTDARDMYDYAHRPEVTKYLLWAPHDGLEYTRSYLKQVERCYRQGTFHDFGVILKENNRFIGTCGFARIDKANSTAEAGYVLNPDYWGRGLATEALSAVIALGFEKRGFNRIESKYMVNNLASRRVMEKSGMTFEGVLRQSIFVKDGYEDIGVCAILKQDYRSVNGVKFTNI